MAEEVGRMGRRDPGFSGAGGPKHNHLRVNPKCVQIIPLGGIERLYGRKFALGLEFCLEFDDFGGLKAP